MTGGVTIQSQPGGQPSDATLTALAGVTFAANTVLVGTGADTVTTKTYPQTTVDNTVPRYDSTGGNLQTSGVVIDDNDGVKARGHYTNLASITDDNVFSFTLGGQGFGLMLVNTSSGSVATSAIVYVIPGTPGTGSLVSGANVNVTTGVLTGTTGVDGKLTVSCFTDGKVYIENRLGGTINMYYTLFVP